jgi:hypothetical protein
MSVFDPTTFPLAIAELLRAERLPPLGPGKPDVAMRPRLEALSGDTAFAPHRVRDRAMADACRAGLWLWFDFLDESHTISQDLSSVEGSYWHAILHRREPDASNSAYWFRRVGQHPVFETLAKDAREFGLQTRSDRWDPCGFIDLCERQRGTGSEEEVLLCRVQRREWQLLFDWCFREATHESKA